jgi:hypothetical protein
MTPAQERVIKAAVELSSAAHVVYSLEQVPSVIIHELFAAVNGYNEEKMRLTLTPDVTKVSIRSDEQFVQISFADALAWFQMLKPQALTFAFAILEHCGVQIEHKIQQDPAKGEPA